MIAVVAAALIGGETAFAVTAATPGGLIQTLDVAHTSGGPGGATGLTTTLTLGRADGSKGVAAKQVDLHAPKGWRWSWTAFPKCDPARLGKLGPSACPKASKVGTGSARADLRPVAPDPVTSTVSAYNGKRVDGRRTFLLYFDVDNSGYSFVVIGKETRKGFIEFPLPRIPIVQAHFTLRTGGKVTSTRMTGGKRRKVVVHYFRNPVSCDGGWPWRFDFTYHNGERLELTTRVPCAT